MRERRIDETLFPYNGSAAVREPAGAVVFFHPSLSRSPLQYANESFRVGATVRSWGVAGVVRI